MEGRIVKRHQMHYLAPGRVEKISVRKKDGTNFQSLHLGTVEISPTICHFEWGVRQEFQVGEELEFLFNMEDGCVSARAIIGWVVKYELLDEGYEQRIWFSYGAEFDGELDADFFRGIAGDPKKSKPLMAEGIL
jgi:hypothetical protein